MSYLDDATLAEQPDFIRRVRRALLTQAAVALQADPQTEGYAESVQMATYAGKEQEITARRAAGFAVLSPLVTGDESDETLQGVIATYWPVFARLFAAAVLLLAVWATPARAQLREVPLEHTNGPTFVEVVESGAAGDLQLIGLRWHGDVSAPDDLLIYDPANGQALLVVAVGVPVPGMWVTSFPLVECFAWVTLRPGLRLEAMDLDRDGRRDLIGHNALTGEVVRLYRRGRGCS